MYEKFIEKIKQQQIPANVYTEVHHILSRHCGGTNDNDNLIVLTYRQHILAHLMFLKPLYVNVV